MGLFDFLKPKEYVASVCHVCGREIAQYNDRKTKDGIICVDCKDAVEALRPGSAYANMTIEEIKDLLSSQGKSEEQLGSCPVCGEKLPALPKKLRDGMICNNCEKKMRYAYFKTTSYKNEYDLNWEEKKMLEAQNAGQLIKSDKLMIFEDEMDILTIDDVKHDLAEDERRISEVPSLFPEYTAVGYYDCMADYQEDDAVWITVLCCKGTINVGDTIIRVEGDIRAEHPVSAIVIPDGYSLEESVESGQSQTLEAGCWGWIRTTGSFVADPNYSGDKYILKK